MASQIKTDIKENIKNGVTGPLKKEYTSRRIYKEPVMQKICPCYDIIIMMQGWLWISS